MLEEIHVVRNFDMHQKYCNFKIKQTQTTVSADVPKYIKSFEKSAFDTRL